MPVYNKSYLTKDAILNILDVCKDIDYEFIILDDGSTDNTTDVISSLYSQSEWRIQYYRFDENVWVTVAWNQWVKYSQWEYICVINNDVIFPKGFFEKLMDWFEDGIGLVNPRRTEWDIKQPSIVMYHKKHICWHCYMFQHKDKDILFPLDESLRIFASDDWLWFHLTDVWLKQKVKHDAICHHLKSQTSFYVPNKDMPIFYNIAARKWWKLWWVYPLPTDDLKKDFIFSC